MPAVLICESLVAGNLAANFARWRADLTGSKHFCATPSMCCGEFPARSAQRICRPPQGILPAWAGNSLVKRGFRQRTRRMADDAQAARRRGPGRYAKAAALQTIAHEGNMKIIDMTHVMNVHTPGWVGYAGNKMYYAQNLQTQMIVAQRIDTALHVGTHFDGAMHATDNRKGDMASLPLDYLVNRGVVVDISAKMSDWAVITPEIIESAGADIREGDILLLHTGWHRHYEGRPRQDLVKYFCFHPGPNLDTLHWMLKKKIKWWGMDTGSCDHAMNTSIRAMRPDLAAQFTK